MSLNERCDLGPGARVLLAGSTMGRTVVNTPSFEAQQRPVRASALGLSLIGLSLTAGSVVLDHVVTPADQDGVSEIGTGPIGERGKNAMGFEVLLKSGKVVRVAEVDAYQPEGAMTTFFTSGSTLQAVSYTHLTLPTTPYV